MAQPVDQKAIFFEVTDRYNTLLPLWHQQSDSNALFRHHRCPWTNDVKSSPDTGMLCLAPFAKSVKITALLIGLLVRKGG